MKGNFDSSLKEVILHQGGLGLTKEVYEEWVGYSVSDTLMRKLTTKHVSAYYKRKFWEVIGGDVLPAGLDLCVFDFATDTTPSRAIRYLQRMIGADGDGVLGPKSKSLLTQFLGNKKNIYAIMRYQDMRRDYYSQVQDYPKTKRDWSIRCNEVELTAISMSKTYRV